MFCFINLTPQTPPSVIHGWKATDLLYEMVKTKKIFLHPVKRQIFGDAPKQTFYMISKLVVAKFDFFGDLRCFVAKSVSAIYALLCGEKISPK